MTYQFSHICQPYSDVGFIQMKVDFYYGQLLFWDLPFTVILLHNISF